MKKKLFRIGSIVMLVILVLVILTLTAGAIAKSNLAKKHPAPGQLVDVGGYKLHINCTGQGNPTVVLDAGAGSFSADWTYVQPSVSKFTRACSYDRAGYGWSEPSPHPRTANTMAGELHTLLVNANVEGPYVLVGHSLGGLVVRMYAYTYPDEVVGMVLVDSMHEEQVARLPGFANSIMDQARQFRMLGLLSSTGFMALAPQTIPNPGVPEEVFAQYKAIWATTEYFPTIAAELNAIEESTAEMRALQISSFGNLPLSVLTAGIYGSDPSISDAENQRVKEEWQAMQSELVARSSKGRQLIAEQSGHAIELYQPDLVIEAIQEMVNAIQE